MKRTLELLCVGLVAGAMLTGCPKKAEETPEPTPATNNVVEEAPETVAAETAAQTAAQAEPINEENFRQALFEKTCVAAKITDTEEAKAITDEIYARYGFDAETFAAATAQIGERTDIKVPVEQKMNDCTPELAASFKNAGEAEGTTAGAATPEPKPDEPKKVAAPKNAWKSGSFNQKGISGGNIEGGDLRISVNDAGKVTGAFQGRREGSAFSVPFQGTIAKDGNITASGNRGTNNVRVTGRYKDGTVSGALQGSINKQNFRLSYSAK